MNSLVDCLLARFFRCPTLLWTAAAVAFGVVGSARIWGAAAAAWRAPRARAVRARARQSFAHARGPGAADFVAVVVVDQSPSQDFGDRTAQTEQARANLPSGSAAAGRGSAFRRGRPGRWRNRRHPAVRGAVTRAFRRAAMNGWRGHLVTDGRVHDVPGEAAALGFNAPLHALITGHRTSATAASSSSTRRASASSARPDHRISRRGPGRRGRHRAR